MSELVIFLLWAGTYTAFWFMYFIALGFKGSNAIYRQANERLRLENEDLRQRLREQFNQLQSISDINPYADELFPHSEICPCSKCQNKPRTLQ